MKSFSGNISKEELLTELREHQRLDNFVKGRYWDGEKGCAVGCSIASINKLRGLDIGKSNHEAMGKALGLPTWLVELEGALFEGVSLKRSKTWPVEFIEAIPDGVDVEQVRVPFLVFVLKENLKLKLPERIVKVTEDVIAALESGSEKQLQAAGTAAAAVAAGAAADGATAWAAAWSAARAAARAAAAAAAWSADGAAVWAAGGAAAWVRFVDELLRLMRGLK